MFFALQTAAAALALGGRLGVTGFAKDDVAVWCASTAVAVGLANLLGLGPKSIPLMMALYSDGEPEPLNGGGDSLLAFAEKRKRFGKVHGMSMLVDLVALAAIGIFIITAA